MGSDPKAGYIAHKEEIDQALARVMSSGTYLNGEELTMLEQEFAHYLGVKYAVGVGSGTEAIYVALMGLGIKDEDEVITVSFTCTPTVAAIEQTGAKAVVIDIEPKYYTLDPEKIEAAITVRTKAILPVHLYGQSAAMEAIKEVADKYGLVVVEDACQAHGAEYKGKKVGGLGNVGCFSFYPTKNLGAFGDAGMVVTNDEQVAKKMRLIREYGWEERHNSVLKGWNARLDELQAAVLRVKLNFLDKENEMRQRITERYRKELKDIDLILPEQRPGVKHAWHQYVVRVKEREGVLQYLRKQGVIAGAHYATPVHRQVAYRNSLVVKGTMEQTEKAANEVMSVPIYPQLDWLQVKQVGEILKMIVGEAVRI